MESGEALPRDLALQCQSVDQPSAALITDLKQRGLLEDTLRGALSAMRLAAQDKAPDFVSVLRKFTVSRTDDSVSVSGTVPAESLKTFAAKANHPSTR